MTPQRQIPLRKPGAAYFAGLAKAGASLAGQLGIRGKPDRTRPQQGQRALIDETPALYQAVANATSGWPKTWRRALLASLPAVSRFPDGAARAQAFQSRVKAAAAIANRGLMVAKRLYGLDPGAAAERLDSAIAENPAAWKRIERLAARHLSNGSPLKTAAAEMLNLLAARDRETAVDTTLTGNLPTSSAAANAWRKTIRKLRDEVAARDRRHARG